MKHNDKIIKSFYSCWTNRASITAESVFKKIKATNVRTQIRI